MTMSLSPRASVVRLAAVFAALAFGHFALSQQPPKEKPPLGDEPLLFDVQAKVLQKSGLRWWAFALSSDGKTLVSCAGQSGEPGEIHIWDLAKGQIRATIKHTAGVRHVAIAPDNKTLAAGCFDNSLRLYDLESLQLKAIGNGHTGAINSVAFTPDGKTLITGGLDNNLKVWMVPTFKADQEKSIEFKPFASLQEHNNWVLSVAVSKDAKTIVSGGNDNIARIWDMPKPAADGKLVEVKKSRRVLSGHSRPVETVAISHDGSMIATGSWDGEARVWDSVSGEEKRRVNSTGFGVLSVAFSPDGKELTVGSGNSGNPGQVRRVDLSGDGNPEQYLGGHANAVWCVGYSPDSKTLISLSEDRSIIVHSVTEPKPQRQLKPAANSADAPQIVLAAAWSPDGTKLAVAGENKGIVIHDVAGKKTRSWMAHDDVVSALAWSPDGKTLASASYDGTVKIWNVANSSAENAKPPFLTLKGHTNWVFALAISPGGTKLASAGYDKSIRIWDLSKMSEAWQVRRVPRGPVIVVQNADLPVTVIQGQGKGHPDGHSAGVRSMVFTPDGQTLISAGADRIIRFWDAANGKPRGEASGHKSAVRAIALAPDGTTLASGSEDMLVKLWTLKREPSGKYAATETIELKGHQDLVSSLAFSPRGRTLAVGLWNGLIHLWDPELGRQRTVLGGHSDAVSVVKFSPDGRQLASGSYDKTVRIWPAGQLPQAAMVEYLKHPAAVSAVALSPDGKWTVTGDQKGTLRIFERGIGTVMQLEIPGVHAGGVTGLAWSPDSKSFVSVGRDKSARAWSAAGGKQRELPGHTDELLCVAWSQDGKFIASAGKDKIVAIWDAKTGQNVKKLPGHTGSIQALGFSPDGKLLASAGADKTFRVWDTQSWTAKHQSFAGATNGEYIALAFSPDSKTLALAHNQEQIITPDGQLEQQQFRSVMLVDPANGQAKPASQNFFFHSDWVTGVAFSADGQSLITTSRDMFVRVWSINNNQVLRQFRGHDAGITALAVDPINNVMATAGDDRAARLWPAAFRRESPRATIAGHTGQQVWFAEFSKDGSMLATGGDDKIVRIRTGIAGIPAMQFAPPFRAAFSVAVSPDGKLMATGHDDGKIEIWNAADGKRIKALTGNKGRVWTVAFLPDNKRLISAGGIPEPRNQPGEVKVWNVEDGKVVREFPSHPDMVYGAAVSTDGKMLATAGRDKSVRLWDIDSGVLKHTLNGHTGGVRTLAFTPDGQTLASSSNEDAGIIFWDVAKGVEKGRQNLPNNTGRVNRLRYSPDGKKLAVVAATPMQNSRQVFRGDVAVAPPYQQQQLPETGMLFLYNVADFKLLGQSGNGSRMLDVAFSPDGSTIATSGGVMQEYGVVALWQGADGRSIGEIRGPKRWLECVTWLNDGRVIGAGGTGGDRPGELWAWDTASLRPTQELKGHTSHVSCGAFSPDGGMLATGSGDKTVILWNLAAGKKSGKVDQRILKHDHQLRAVRFSPDGKLLVSSDEGGYVKFWNPITGENVKTFQAHSISVYGLTFSPDGATLATAAGNWKAKAKGEVKFWNAITGQPAGELPQHPSEVWATAFSPDGKLVATASGDAQVRVYELASKKLVRTLTSPTGLRTVAWSPDGATLAAGNGTDNDPTARLWDTTNWMERATLQGHTAMIFTVRFSPDSKTLATASKDGTVKMWDVIPPPKPAVASK